MTATAPPKPAKAPRPERWWVQERQRRTRAALAAQPGYCKRHNVVGAAV